MFIAVVVILSNLAGRPSLRRPRPAGALWKLARPWPARRGRAAGVPRVAGRSGGRCGGSVRKKPLGAAGGVLMAAHAADRRLRRPGWRPTIPIATDAAHTLARPGAAHWLGTDHLGRDIYSRIVHGARDLADRGRGVDAARLRPRRGHRPPVRLRRRPDRPGRRSACSTSSRGCRCSCWRWSCRPRSGPSLDERGHRDLDPHHAAGGARRPRRASSRSARCSTWRRRGRSASRHLRIAFRHVLPNTMGPFIVLCTAQLGSAILVEAALSFLGLGVPEPYPSWGRMLSVSAAEYAQKAPHLVLFPGPRDQPRRLRLESPRRRPPRHPRPPAPGRLTARTGRGRGAGVLESRVVLPACR